jgi:hypothetical protein
MQGINARCLGEEGHSSPLTAFCIPAILAQSYHYYSIENSVRLIVLAIDDIS